ncbi:DUF2512 family protein [Saccharibacillus alkalitolerans]|uniref:DUF2512 family protein n=1 Tax=Saccharibacillus alkalitolerans TaxID=2705290 RepID=A0ABX0F865_9BACL|nr:DUF2512 family protein [Saccharibacillus alkalitolerans]NGZ76585.1 DUF2512 family protein [Saccharibacillus alkalitolerans]
MAKLAVKMLANAVVVIGLTMWFGEADFVSALIVTVILGAIAYVLGDMLILPAAGNTAATIGDAALTYLVLWGASSMLGWNLSFFEMFVIALVVGIFEFFFHVWLLQSGIPGRKDNAGHQRLPAQR